MLLCSTAPPEKSGQKKSPPLDYRKTSPAQVTTFWFDTGVQAQAGKGPTRSSELPSTLRTVGPDLGCTNASTRAGSHSRTTEFQHLLCNLEGSRICQAYTTHPFFEVLVIQRYVELRGTPRKKMVLKAARAHGGIPSITCVYVYIYICIQEHNYACVCMCIVFLLQHMPTACLHTA